ncbi:MAG: acyl-CoA thioesterase [Pseudomonadota bacterium]
MAFETSRLVEWGDCDPAGIAFYPNFFRWMDSAFHEMAASLGFGHAGIADHGLFATPLRDVGATFRSPARPGVRLEIGVGVTRIGRSGFALAYAFTADGQAVASGREDRVCVTRDEAGAIAKAPIPDSLRRLLEAQHE